MMRMVAGLGLVVLVAGCSSSSSAGPTPLPPLSASGVVPSAAPSASGSASARPTLAPVEKPALADEATEAGAEAFARYWVEVRNHAYQTLDPSKLDRISAPGCVTCRAYSTSMRRGAAVGERWEGGLASVRSAVAPPIEDGSTSVLVDYTSTAFAAYDKEGRVLTRQPARERATLEIVVQRRGKQWLAQEVARA